MKPHFLLGGHDLEMIEIRQILEKNQIPFSDNKLSWGASLSAYKPVFNPTDLFVGVELKEEGEFPAHYVAIDHHNENSDKPPSIVQVIRFLRENLGLTIPMTRRIELIAANDSGYIPAMEKLGASAIEISQIRMEDRKAQGVTAEEEREAEELIQSKIKPLTDFSLVLVETTLNRFSPITDRFQVLLKNRMIEVGCSNLVIFNTKELTLYGSLSQIAVNRFETSLIKSQKAYFGGSPIGFFGVPDLGDLEGESIAEKIDLFKKRIL